jgi:hypothetical protein
LFVRLLVCLSVCSFVCLFVCFVLFCFVCQFCGWLFYLLFLYSIVLALPLLNC